MKFKELLIDLLLEQDQDANDPELDDDGMDPDADAHAEGHNEDPLPDFNINGGGVEIEKKYKKPNPKGYEDQKKFSRTQLIKLKWRDENPAITDQQASDAVMFFNERKDRLKPYHPYGYVDPTTNRHYVNLPEITALVERFPDMEKILSDDVRMKDLGNYTWGQISFYMDRIYRQAIEVDNENWIKGDFTEDQRIQMALQRWSKPYNQLINDGTLTVYKVECKAEAIALGALDHALFRKYRDDNVLDALPPEIRRKVNAQEVATQPWCIARPLGGKWGGNLWTNYRPQNAFYFILDRSKPEWHEYHVTALQSLQNGGYDFSSLYNNTTYPSWEEVESIYPGLRGKKNLFPWFGTTQREKKELTLDTVTFRKGDQYDFAVLPDAVHTTFIENNRFIPNVRAFLSLSFKNRKLYIDKTSKENEDFKQRFLCDDANDPFGILEILRVQKTKDGDLYKYLDGFTLKERLGIPDGILAIKKCIIGTDWRRWLSDVESNATLVSTRSVRMTTAVKPKYGIMNIQNAELIKDIRYLAEFPRSYMHTTEKDENGKPKKYIFQRYVYSLGNGQISPTEYFYFLCLVDAFTNRESEYYLKGKYYDGRDGDEFIQKMVSSGKFRKSRMKKVLLTESQTKNLALQLVNEQVPAGRAVEYGMNDGRYRMKCEFRLDYEYTDNPSIVFKGGEITDMNYAYGEVSFAIEIDHKSYGIHGIKIRDIRGPNVIKSKITYLPPGAKFEDEDYFNKRIQEEVSIPLNWRNVQIENDGAAYHDMNYYGVYKEIEVRIQPDGKGGIEGGRMEIVINETEKYKE